MNPHHIVGGKRHSLVGEETCVESEREGVARCALCATGRGLTASLNKGFTSKNPYRSARKQLNPRKTEACRQNTNKN